MTSAHSHGNAKTDGDWGKGCHGNGLVSAATVCSQGNQPPSPSSEGRVCVVGVEDEWGGGRRAFWWVGRRWEGVPGTRAMLLVTHSSPDFKSWPIVYSRSGENWLFSGQGSFCTNVIHCELILATRQWARQFFGRWFLNATIILIPFKSP